MKYYYTYKNALINIGDVTEDGTIAGFSNGRIRVTTSTGDEINLRTPGPNYIQHECPALAIYDRITGVRLRAGDTSSAGVRIQVIYSDCARAVKVDDAACNYIWFELAANRSHVDADIEIVNYPAFEELESRTRHLASDGTVMVAGVRNKLLPAADCIWIDGHYRLISDYSWLASNGQFVKANTAGYVTVSSGGLARENETTILTAGAHVGERAYAYDVYALPDGRVCLLEETTLIRTASGESRALEMPAGFIMIDGVAHEADSVIACAGDGTMHWRPNMYRYEGVYYGRDYFQRHAIDCSCCGSYYMPAIDATNHPTRCATCAQESKYRVQSYSNREANDYRPERNVAIKFGIELEVGCDRGFRRAACTKTMIDAIGTDQYVVLKEDGSISECYGFEVVTRPDCPSVHKRIWANALAVPEVRQQMSSWTNGKCGIHIHVSRRPLSDLWVGRMLVLINADKMQPVVHAVAGRSSSSYTKYIKKNLTDATPDNRSCDRYEALNTSGDHTIEFRIFRGTLEPAGFMKNIEFVEAVLAYCKPASRSLRDIDNPERFIEFVAKSRKDYPALHAFLQAKCTN